MKSVKEKMVNWTIRIRLKSVAYLLDGIAIEMQLGEEINQLGISNIQGHVTHMSMSMVTTCPLYWGVTGSDNGSNFWDFNYGAAAATLRREVIF